MSRTQNDEYRAFPLESTSQLGLLEAWANRQWDDRETRHFRRWGWLVSASASRITQGSAGRYNIY